MVKRIICFFRGKFLSLRVDPRFESVVEWLESLGYGAKGRGFESPKGQSHADCRETTNATDKQTQLKLRGGDTV